MESKKQEAKYIADQILTEWVSRENVRSRCRRFLAMNRRLNKHLLELNSVWKVDYTAEVHDIQELRNSAD